MKFDDLNIKRNDLIFPNELIEDQEVEETLRPRKLEDFIGQEKIKEQLSIFLEAAKRRNEPIDHILFHGPPGLGKTTLSQIISSEMGVEFKATSGPILEKAGDLAGLLTNLDKKDVLFIDEVHRINRVVEEYLYSAMEDFCLDIMLDQGPNARSVRLNISPFTLVGATTRAGLLTSPMRARFGIVLRMEYYSPDELYDIIIRSANILKVEIDREGALEIAKRSRGTPRISNRLLKRIRDIAQVKGNGIIDLKTAKYGLDLLEIDEFGLDEMDKRILRMIGEKFNGGPVGISTISAAVSEEKDTIEEVYEPYLIQQGFLIRTPRGRTLTPLAYNHLGINFLDKKNQYSQMKMDL